MTRNTKPHASPQKIPRWLGVNVVECPRVRRALYGPMLREIRRTYARFATVILTSSFEWTSCLPISHWTWRAGTVTASLCRHDLQPRVLKSRTVTLYICSFSWFFLSDRPRAGSLASPLERGARTTFHAGSGDVTCDGNSSTADGPVGDTEEMRGGDGVPVHGGVGGGWDGTARRGKGAGVGQLPLCDPALSVRPVRIQKVLILHAGPVLKAVLLPRRVSLSGAASPTQGPGDNGVGGSLGGSGGLIGGRMNARRKSTSPRYTEKAGVDIE